MGLKYTLRLFRGLDPTNFRHLIERTVAGFGGSINWWKEGFSDHDFRTSSKDYTHTAYLPYQEADFPFFRLAGKLSGLPWIELRIQEGAIWDYSLYKGEEHIDQFSVCPQYWDDGAIGENDLDSWRGNPETLAELWSLPVDRVRRYLVNWGHEYDAKEGIIRFPLAGKAYSSDEYGYGQYEQFFDILKVLGGAEPDVMHTLTLPQGKAQLR